MVLVGLVIENGNSNICNRLTPIKDARRDREAICLVSDFWKVEWISGSNLEVVHREWNLFCGASLPGRALLTLDACECKHRGT